MSDTISRQAAIDAVNDWWIAVDDNRHPVNVIKALPSVQPQEIIRCKDCKWHGGKYHCRDTDTWGFDDDDFCSHAERRTDE